jgi:hypothetical protein
METNELETSLFKRANTISNAQIVIYCLFSFICLGFSILIFLGPQEDWVAAVGEILLLLFMGYIIGIALFVFAVLDVILYIKLKKNNIVSKKLSIVSIITILLVVIASVYFIYFTITTNKETRELENKKQNSSLVSNISSEEFYDMCKQKNGKQYEDIKPNMNILYCFSDTGNYRLESTDITRKAELDKRIKEKEDLQNEKNKIPKVHYDFLTEEFKTPQKIIGTNGPQLVTENNILITFINDPQILNYQQQAQAEKLADSLIDKKVTIVLPPFEEFVKKYNYGPILGSPEIDAFNLKGQVISRGSSPVDPVYKQYIGMVYANVFYNAVLINGEIK